MSQDPYVLVAPDFAALDTLARRTEPAALWPVGSQSLVAHWLDHAVRLGHRRVVIHAADRPAMLREALHAGAYWSLTVEISTTPAPATAVPMLALPGETPAATPYSPAALLQWWSDLNARWLTRRDPAAVSIDRPRSDGGWVAPRVKIDSTAVMIPPYWIGADTEIGPECRVGPFAAIGPRCILERDVHVANAVVLEATFLGRHLDAQAKLIDGGVLLDPRKGTRVEIAEKFIASRMGATLSIEVPWYERLLAAALWLPARLLAIGTGSATAERVELPDRTSMILSTRPKGRRLARRSGWLRHVIVGRLRLIGVSPHANAAGLSPESAELLRRAVPGVFSLADLHDGPPKDEDGFAAHALYQAAMPEGNRQVWRNLFRLCWERPASSAP